MKSILKLLLSSIALIIIAYLLPGLEIIEPQYALIGALFIALTNLIIKPILIVLTFPITILSLGLFIIIINAFLFWIATILSPGIMISGFGTAILASILFSIISWALEVLFLND